MDLYEFSIHLHGSMLIHMHFHVFICVFDVFMSLVWPTSVLQAFLSGKKKAFPDFVDMSSLKMSRIVGISCFLF